MQQELLQSALADLLTASAVQDHSDYLFVQPETEEEVAKVLAFASEHHLGVVPQGGGSQTHLGGLVQRKDILLSLKRLQGVLEYAPADLTVTVQAGTPVQELQEVLRESGQWLALDPILAKEATVGGMVATNANGPKRLRYGALRDQVIGMRIAYPNGKIIKTGGKVVKNVAGYDMGKLFIGSLGTLGVITEVTFKLHPLPSHQEVVFLRPASFTDAQRLQQEILDSELIPNCMELLSPFIASALGRPFAGTLIVGCDEGPSGAAYQRERLRSIAGTETVDILQDEEADAFWHTYRDVLSKPSDHIIQCKVSLLPMHVIPFLRFVTEYADRKRVGVNASAGLGTGIVRLYLNEKETTDATLLDLLDSWREWAEMRHGASVIERSPDWVKQRRSVWGKERGEYVLMRRIKQAIDPEAILNAGRFIGGI